MAWNGSGVFARLYNWATDKTNGIKIRADRMDGEFDNFKTGLENCVTLDGQNTPSANLPMGNFKHTGVGNAAARNHYAAAGQVQDQSFIWCGTGGGTADAITLSPSPAITAYAAGQKFSFIASGANTTNVTVNVSSLGAKAVTKRGTTALAAGNIPSGAVVVIQYDGTQFQLLSVANLGADISSPEFADNVFRLTGSSDATKKGAVELDGNTAGTTRTGTWLDYNFRFMSQTKGSDVASASTIDLDAASGDLVDVTGTTTVTAITLAEGKQATVRFTGALTLTHGASLVLPGAANITTVAGDVAVFRGYAAGVVRCVSYMPITLPPTRPILGTEQATTSGASIDFTSIPSWVKRITIILDGVSTNGTSLPIIQIGDSGGIENTGYSGSCGHFSSGGNALATFSSGFGLHGSWAAANVLHCTIVLSLEDTSNTWGCSIAGGRSDGGIACCGGGTKQLSATLDRVRLTTAGGTDTFDAGAVNILYE